MVKKEQHNFIFPGNKDELGVLINDKANELFAALKELDVNNLEIGAHFKEYFVQHHLGNRLFFSLQNSAGIIYQSVKRTGRQPADINFADYGAGLGTLYMLAGMLPFKKVVYNDYLPEWKQTAAAICSSLQIPISAYITGDIDAVLAFAEQGNFKYDIIASRNVLEHIYSPAAFFEQVYRHHPNAVVFSTTTANYQNPVTRLQHYLIHTRIEKQQYLPVRTKQVQELWPEISREQLNELAAITRGRAGKDFTDAVQQFKNGQPVAAVPFLRSNTCLADTGYWCEHLLTKNEYRNIIEQAGFKMEYSAGYWDTHYRSGLKNGFMKLLNGIVKILGEKGYVFSPFVNIVAYKG